MFKKKIIAVVFILAIGIAAGYLWGSNRKSTKLSVGNSAVSNQAENASQSASNEKTALKLDLLKNYVNFVYLPAEEIKDSQDYADRMAQEVEAIGDSQIMEKFQATGSGEDREKKILEFFNFLIGDIKSNLN